MNDDLLGGGRGGTDDEVCTVGSPDVTPLTAEVVEPEGAALVGELVIDRDEGERARSLLHKRAGIALFPVKHERILRRLRERMQRAGAASFAQYLDRLEAGDQLEFETFIRLLTNGETGFFREPHHFDALGERFRELGRARPIRVWSVGTATGEEAYSIAITAIEAFGSWAPPVSVLATDVDHTSLELARGGVFPVERLANVEPMRLQRYFFKGSGTYAGSYRVRPELQAMIRWRHADVTDPSWPVRGPFDAIFCRNVLGYIEPDVQKTLAGRLASNLRVGGMVFAGNAEIPAMRQSGLRPRGGAVYQLASRRR